MKTNDEIIKKWENTSKYYDGFGGYITPNEILKMLNEARSDERTKLDKEWQTILDERNKVIDKLTKVDNVIYIKEIEHKALADFCKEVEPLEKALSALIKHIESVESTHFGRGFNYAKGRAKGELKRYLALKQKHGIKER